MKTYQPIENYGIVGDLNTSALIGLDGSVDFLCFPDFDSPSIFAALLDVKKGGYFKIFPQNQKMKNKQMYLPDTNILLTRFLACEGVAEILDFMPVAELSKGNMLIRKVKSIRGEISLHMECKPRFDYSLTNHRAFHQENAIIFEAQKRGGLVLRLTSSIPLTINHGDGYASFILKPGEEANFILETLPEGKEAPQYDLDKFVADSLFLTMNYWKTWVSQSTYNGRWREMVIRSALVLKLLTSNQYGSIIASPTFGLPERIGGDKNWDYRYSWIRDAAFTVYALLRLGYNKEARGFMKWVEKLCQAIGKGGHINLMYRINGESHLEEKILKQYEGYCESSPVRIGNNAYKQLQLDIYGELMDAVYLYNKHVEPISHDFWINLVYQMDWLCEHWKEKDHGIWEVRKQKRSYLYSRLMCWVAIDRALKIASTNSLPANPRWREVRDKIYRSIYQDFWNDELQSFVQYKGAKVLDAATLLMPLVRFISAKDQRWLSTMQRIEERLGSDSLIYRYRLHGLAKATSLYTEEGTFSVCTFWFVECLSRAGQLQKARFYFEKMLSYGNHLGLFSEQLGFQGEHLGNFPQSFTHLGLISAAFHLDYSLSNQRNKETDETWLYISKQD